MIERQQLQIEFIGKASSKREYCDVPCDKNVRNSLIQLLDLERQLSEDELSAERWGVVMLTHIRLWNELQEYYKSALSDLTAIIMQL